MNRHRLNARITGIFYILAAIFSIIGLILYSPIVADENFLISGPKNANRIVLGAVCEMILACCATGTAVMLFSYLRHYNERIALGFLLFRFLEVVFIVIGVISVLSVLSIGQWYAESAGANQEHFIAVGIAFKSAHSWAFILGPNFMLGLNTFLCAYLLFRSGIVHPLIAKMGFLGAIVIFLAAMLELFDIIEQVSTWGALLAIPIFAYEMSLAVWLLVKGFDIERYASSIETPGTANRGVSFSRQ